MPNILDTNRRTYTLCERDGCCISARVKPVGEYHRPHTIVPVVVFFGVSGLGLKVGLGISLSRYGLP